MDSIYNNRDKKLTKGFFITFFLILASFSYAGADSSGKTFMLTINGPNDFHYEKEVIGRSASNLDVFEEDGLYRYEYTQILELSDDMKDRMKEARSENNEKKMKELKKILKKKKISKKSGHFRVIDGERVRGDKKEKETEWER